MATKKSSSKQSMNGLVRERLAEINLRISYGVRIAAIHSEYASNGMGGNLLSFRKAITRARKRLRLEALDTGQRGRAQAPGGPVGEAHKSAALKEPAQPVSKEVTDEVQGEASRSGGRGESDPLDKYFKRESIFSKRG